MSNGSATGSRTARKRSFSDAVTTIIRFMFKLLWRTLHLVLWLLAAALRLTLGLAWRRTFGRSTVYVRREYNLHSRSL